MADKHNAQNLLIIRAIVEADCFEVNRYDRNAGREVVPVARDSPVRGRISIAKIDGVVEPAEAIEL
jgi:hypothetical protein